MSSQSVPKHIWALCVAWVRAAVLLDGYAEVRDRFDARGPTDPTPAAQLDEFAEALRVISYLEVWLAALQVVVEGYDRYTERGDESLRDAAIDSMLSASEATQLRRFRNTVFHPELRDHAHVVSVLNDYAHFVDWGTALLAQFHRVILNHHPGLNPSRQGSSAQKGPSQRDAPRTGIR